MNSLTTIWVAGVDSDARQDAEALVRRAGFEHIEARDELVMDKGASPPALVIVTGPSAGALAETTRRVPGFDQVPVAVFVDESQGERERDGRAAVAALDAGADDAISARTPLTVTRAQLGRLLALGQERRRAAELAHLQDALLEIHTVSTREGTSAEVLREILLIAVEVMGFERASLIAHIAGSPAAYVIAATDAPSLSQFVIALEHYPELARVIDTKAPLLLDDAQSDPITAPVAHLLADTDVRAVAAYPVTWKGSPVGVVVFRKSQPGVGQVSDAQMSFARTFAAHAATCLEHGRVMASLRERTPHRLSRARYEAERRLRTIESLKEHFEAAADGVLVLDEDGRILFVNRAAESITGFAREGLMGSKITALVPDAGEESVRRVIARVLGGHNLDAFDLDLRTTSGETICASVTTSTVLGQSGAAVLSFRDVTAQRALELELRQTKEFLEKLVDSTVDAIVAADMRGNVIIFNQGAERIYGYRADEVIGRIPVWKLYAAGVPKQVMRMLRSTQYGGVGRLEQTRREIMTKHGDLVPVNMTASIIYQDGREVATVGIFSDLRDRIRIEQRLLQAQEKLQLTEKQAVVAELAGTAAHELNQPLTSIMGYAQLIQRQSDDDAPHQRAVDIILREAERMAEIVKKIGRITKYETMEYVGSTRVLDLDRSVRAATNDLVEAPERRPEPQTRDAARDAAQDAGDAEDHDDEVDNEFESDVTTQVQLADLVRRSESKRGLSSDQARDSSDDSESETQDEQRVP